MIAFIAAACFILLLHHRAYNLRLIAVFVEGFDNLVFVRCTKCLQCNAELYSRASVRRYELIVLQLDDISVDIGDHACDPGKFARLIRQKNGNCKDSVSECIISIIEEIISKSF